MDCPEYLGPYKIIDTLGHGGMGVVYHARHRKTDEVVALKTVLAIDELQLQGIRREIRGLARIHHPGIVKIVSEGIDHGHPWYAMELLSGQTLKQYINTMYKKDSDRKAQVQEQDSDVDSTRNVWMTEAVPQIGSKTEPTFTPETTSNDMTDNSQPVEKTDAGVIEEDHLAEYLRLMRGVCVPLAFLHGEGYVHRDLKPENIFITADKRPVLVDFGLVNRFSNDISRETLAVDHSYGGTVLYMSPEQIRGEFVDARTDLYALGCILYEMIVGHPPFVGVNSLQIMQAHLKSEPVPPSRFKPNIPPDLDELILRLLTKDPRSRLGFADTVASLLARNDGDNLYSGTVPESQAYLYRSGLTGRDTQLQLLREQFSHVNRGQGRIVFIGGESGIGKTRLAQEFALVASYQDIPIITGDCSEDNPTVLYVLRRVLQAFADRCLEGGESETDRILGHRGKILAVYESALHDLPGQEKYPEPVELSIQDAKLRLYQYLWETLIAYTNGSPLLLILDDLQWADELGRDFLLHLLKGNYLASEPLFILGTYRSDEMDQDLNTLVQWPGVENIDLTRLDESAISSIVEDMLALTRAPQIFCQFLSRHSEGNPFFVAEYLRVAVTEKILFRDTMGRWQIGTPGEREAKDVDFETLPLPRSLQDLIDRRVSGLPDKAKKVIAAAAILGRESQVLILETMIGLSSTEFFDALDILMKKQILERHEAEKIQFIHAKFRDRTLAKISPEKRITFHRTAAESIEKINPDHRENWAAELGYHWEWAGNFSKARDYYRQAAQIAENQYAYIEAIRLYSALLNLLEKSPPAYFEVQNTLGQINAHIGNLQQAENLFNKNLSVVLFCPDPDKRKKAATFNNLGHVLCTQGKFDQSREHHEKALEFRRQYVGEDHPDTAETYNNLGLLYDHLGDYQKAIDYHKSALAIRKKSFGEQNKDTAMSYNNVGMGLARLGEYDQSLQFFETSLSIKLEVFGENHPDVTETINNIGATHRLKGEYDQAMTFYKRCLEIQTRIISARHYFSGLSHNNMGDLYLRKGEWDQAIKHYSISLDIQKACFGDVHPYVAMAFNGIGFGQAKKNELDKAISSFRKCEAILHQIFGDKHPYLASVYNNMGDVFRLLQQYDTAITYLNNAISLSIQLSGPDNPPLIEFQHNLGSTLFDMQEYDQALEHLEKSLALGKKINGLEHPVTAATHELMGRVFMATGNKQAAQEHLGTALTIFESTNNHSKCDEIKKIMNTP